MRLGRVVIDMGYVVDLDNDEMVKHAEDSVYEDVMNAVKYNELGHNIEVIEAPDATEDEIPEFLLDDGSVDDD